LKGKGRLKEVRTKIGDFLFFILITNFMYLGQKVKKFKKVP
jgi:hypothetical protein